MTEMTPAHRIFSNGICSPVSCSGCHGIRRTRTGPAPRPRSFACLRNSTKTSRDRRSNQVEKWERRERGRNKKGGAKTEVRIRNSEPLASFGNNSHTRSSAPHSRCRPLLGRHRKELRSKTLMAKLSSVFRPSSLFFSSSSRLLGSLLGILVAERMLFSRSPSNRYRRRSSPSLRQRRGRQGLSRNISHNY